MGYWNSPNGIIGDHPADIMDEAIEEIRTLYHRAFEREPTKGEIYDVLAFTLAPRDELPDGAADCGER